MKRILLICAFASQIIPSLASVPVQTSLEVSESVTADTGISRAGNPVTVAHATYWNCSRGGWSRDSFAGVKAACEVGMQWCELDVNYTKDKQIIVFHNGGENGHIFNDSNYEQLSDIKLKNGEQIPLLEDVLRYAKKHKDTKLLIELKYCKTITLEQEFARECVKMVRKCGMQDQVGFISFSDVICKELVKEVPGNVVQFITYNKSAEAVKSLGVNGVDYEYHYILSHPEAVARSHELGLTVNVWTCDNETEKARLVAAGIDMLTTNTPALAEPVDLGLSVRWADRNFGAFSPSKMGECFTWDAAVNVDYPELWRLPTFAEYEELMTRCTWTWDKVDGMIGLRVAGPSGAEIFLPACGYTDGGKTIAANQWGYLWSSTQSPNFVDEGLGLNFGAGSYRWYSGSKGFTLPVRLVKE